MGKWLSILAFAIICGLILDSQLTPSDYTPSIQVQIVPVIVQVIALSLILNLIYSRKIKRFLGEKIEDKASKMWNTN